jgi:hypothetical protein
MKLRLKLAIDEFGCLTDRIAPCDQGFDPAPPTMRLQPPSRAEPAVLPDRRSNRLVDEAVGREQVRCASRVKLRGRLQLSYLRRNSCMLAVPELFTSEEER